MTPCQITIYADVATAATGDIVLEIEVAAVDPAEDDDLTNNDSITPANDSTIDNHHDTTNVPAAGPLLYQLWRDWRW